MRKHSRAKIYCWLLLIIAGIVASNALAATPEQLRKQVGIYVWGRVPDLGAAVDDAKRLGANHAIRAFIGPWSDNPPFTADLRPLATKLGDAAYQKLIREYSVIMLTAYDSFSYAKAYGAMFQPDSSESAQKKTQHHPAHPSSKIAHDLSAMTGSEAKQFLDQEREEFRKFSYELSKSDRTFIVSNWEAENDVPDSRDWGWFVRYLQARYDGILEGKNEARQKGLPGHVYTAFEFTIIPGFQGRRSGLLDIGSKLRGIDYLSYSSWWSIGADHDAEKIKQSFRSAFQMIRSGAKDSHLTIRLIVGEFGEYWNLHPDGERMKALAEVAIDEGAEYLFNWVLYDQPGEIDEWGHDASHFGKYDLNRKLTPQGEAFRRWFTTETPKRPSQPVHPKTKLIIPRKTQVRE